MLSLDALQQIIPNLSSASEEYKRSFYTKYRNYIYNSEVPPQFQNSNIDIDKLPKNLKTLYENITTIVDDNYNLLFSFIDYEYTHNIASMLISEYFLCKASQNEPFKTIVYADTNLLLEDYKRLITDSSLDNYIPPVHSIQTLTKNIECAECVIWDKSTMLKSSYEREKFYDLISIRYRKGLGNIFFIKGGKDGLYNSFNNETANVMDLDGIIDCSKEKVPLKQDTKKGSIQW